MNAKAHPDQVGFPTQQVLELACAAQRHNGRYVKAEEEVLTSDASLVKWSNKALMYYMASPDHAASLTVKPPLLCTNMDDAEIAKAIKSHFKKLIFKAVDGTDEFATNIFSLLNSETVPLNKFGFIACLPSIFEREFETRYITEKMEPCDNATLGVVDDKLLDMDSEIIRVSRSKNFDAWIVLAIIDNKICSWMSKTQLTLGPAVVIRANIKGFTNNWHTKKPETRLNYVKVAQ